MKRQAGGNAFRNGLIALALLLPAIVPLTNAAEVEPRNSKPTPAPKHEQDEELDEALVNGVRIKPERDAQKVIDWLARLVGQFTTDGQVDLQGKGNPADMQPVRGSVDCLGFGPAPAVQCQLDIRWPQVRGPNGEEALGGVSTLDPAVMLFGFEPDHIGIRYMLVDSKGIADGALGLIVDDTLISRTPCVNIPGNCQRVVHITAAPDHKVIEMQIDLEIDYRKAVTFDFVMHRVPGANAVVIGGKP